MILHSELFLTGYPLLLRRFFRVQGAYAINAPAESAWLRVSASGAGGFKDDAPGWGGGAAFAFAHEACAAGDAFTLQVGDTSYTRPSQNTVLGDSWVKRGDSSVLVYADRGRPDGSSGLAANSTGAITRDGSAATAAQGGASAGDDADPYPLGFGGRGASTKLAAWAGAGGGYQSGPYDFPTFPAGDGMICVEFFARNPGY